MKKFLLSALSLLVLAACGGGSTAVACTNQYWDGAVGTCLPSGWHVVDRTALDQRGVPPEVVVAFQADQPFSGQFATVTVTREALSKQMTSTEYSEASIQTVSTMAGYTKVDTTSLTIDGEKVTLHTFTAQPRTDQPKTRFFQVSVASGTTGYTYTAATPVAVDSTLEQQVLLILKNVTLKAPTAKKEYDVHRYPFSSFILCPCPASFLYPVLLFWLWQLRLLLPLILPPLILPTSLSMPLLPTR